MAEINRLNAEIARLNATLFELQTTYSKRFSSVEKDYLKGSDANGFWLLFGGVLVFFMQAGFSLLEAGSVREKNVNNILYKNLMDAAIGALAFWWFGFGFAYGHSENDNVFIGTSNYALWKETDDNNPHMGYINFFFQWAFAATAATIVSGAVAERTKISAYFLYSFFLTAFVYPVVVHWVWDSEGFLCSKMIDFAGSGVVHMVGGFSALMGAIIVGPRRGRFEKPANIQVIPEPIYDWSSHKVYPIPGHSSLLAALGVSILWVGWYGFNCVSTLQIQDKSLLAAKVAVTTTLSAASGAVTVTLYQKIVNNVWDLLASLNGVLAGLVGITAGCAVVDPWASFVIGAISGFTLLSFSWLLKRLKVDDPLDAFPVHGACGIWGCLAAGIFCSESNVLFAGYDRADQVRSGEQFGTQCLGVLVIALWSSVVPGLLFFIINLTLGMRVDAEEEDEGLDEAEHGGIAYHHDMKMSPISPAKNDDVKLGKPDEGSAATA